MSDTAAPTPNGCEHQLADYAGQIFARDIDLILNWCLSGLVGGNFKPEQLRGRLTKVTTQESHNEIFSLDGKPFLLVMPAAYSLVNDQGQLKLMLEVRYKTYHVAPPSMVPHKSMNQEPKV